MTNNQQPTTNDQQPIVECHSGHEYAQRPIALTWEGRRLAVAEVLAEWRTPQGKCFRVRTEDGRIFELEYVEAEDEWQIGRW